MIRHCGIVLKNIYPFGNKKVRTLKKRIKQQQQSSFIDNIKNDKSFFGKYPIPLGIKFFPLSIMVMGEFFFFQNPLVPYFQYLLFGGEKYLSLLYLLHLDYTKINPLMRYSIPVMVIGLNLIPLSSEFSLLSPFALSITHILLNKSIMDEKNFQLSEEQEALLKGKFMLSVLFHFLFIYVLLLKTLYHYEIFAKERKLDEFNRQNRLIYKSNP